MAELVQAEPSKAELIQAMLHDLVDARLHLLFRSNLDRDGLPHNELSRRFETKQLELP